MRYNTIHVINASTFYGKKNISRLAVYNLFIHPCRGIIYELVFPPHSAGFLFNKWRIRIINCVQYDSASPASVNTPHCRYVHRLFHFNIQKQAHTIIKFSVEENSAFEFFMRFNFPSDREEEEGRFKVSTSVRDACKICIFLIENSQQQLKVV